MTKTRSFRRHMTLAVVRAAMITAGLAGSYLGVGAMLPDLVETQVPTPVPTETQGGAQAHTPTEATRLMDEVCAPYDEGTIPGHAVISHEGSITYTDSHLPLTQIDFDLNGVGTDLGIDIFAFCL